MGIIQRRRKRQQSQNQATVEEQFQPIDGGEEAPERPDVPVEAAEEAEPMGATMVPPVSSTPPKPTLLKERKKKTTGAGGVLPQ